MKFFLTWKNCVMEKVSKKVTGVAVSAPSQLDILICRWEISNGTCFNFGKIAERWTFLSNSRNYYFSEFHKNILLSHEIHIYAVGQDSWIKTDLKSILREALFLDRLYNCSFSTSNSILDPFLRSKFRKTIPCYQNYFIFKFFVTLIRKVTLRSSFFEVMIKKKSENCLRNAKSVYMMEFFSVKI